MWLDGEAYWGGVQMDEAALPILLVDLARRQGALPDGELATLWPMVERAAGFLVRNGPVTGEDRWEEDGGYTPFTLGGRDRGPAGRGRAGGAERGGGRRPPTCARPPTPGTTSSTAGPTSPAPTWRGSTGVDGYYCRITPGDTPDGVPPTAGDIEIKNRPQDHTTAPAAQIVSPDALAYVRFGLRAADDPRIVATVKVIDALLRQEFPTGPCWRRYNEDGYGEHEDGSPFDGTGIGRHWPLLTGERAHYELAAGRRDEAERLLGAMESFASDGGLLPEQIWDAPDIPDLELYLGRPSGSAMPLVWAHAEHVKLLRSLRDGAVFDTPPQTVRRYLVDKTASPLVVWRFNHKLRGMPRGRILRVETLAPATVRWSADGWQTVTDAEARDTGFGVWVADLPTADLPAGATVLLTFRWAPDRWEGQDFAVAVEQEG